MKPNKGSGQKSLNSKLSHEKKMNQTGVKNTGMNQRDTTKSNGKRPLGQDGHMNMDEDDMKGMKE